MEIHRRTRQPTSNATTNTSSKNNNGDPVTSRGHSYKGPPIRNPYAVTSTMTDVILLRSIQILLLLAAVWFLSLMVAVGAPESNTSPGASPASESGGGGRRGPPSTLQQIPENPQMVDSRDVAAARSRISHLREEFYERYGGKDAATEMLRRGVRTFESKDKKGDGGSSGGASVVHPAADRFLGAIASHEMTKTELSRPPEFVMAFAGYSVTVGRGNRLEQSYPFVLERLLSPILRFPPLGMKLVVRNSAIGGIPSFPYGWCLRNFLGDDADLVSWDYGMNEGNGVGGLESYVRQSLMMPKSPPLFMLLDTKRSRLDLLQKYVDWGLLPDPIALRGREAVDKKLLQLVEAERPPGLKEWDKWGAPAGAPGQSSWHPKKMEHELMGWMLAMHFLEVLEVVLDVMERDVDWRRATLARTGQYMNRFGKEVILPKPFTDVSETGVASLLHGMPLDADASKWHMRHISCRTSFLPNLSGNLGSIVESGVTNDEDDMLQTRDDSLFNLGWVMDVGKLERDTKLKVEKYGGLGYIDMKTALYGIPSSGTLRFWLPHEGLHNSAIKSDEKLSASLFFGAVVLCEVNEKRGDKECSMVSDLEFSVGGVSLSKDNVTQVRGVASYLKKDICIHLEAPKEAKISYKGDDLGLAVEVVVKGSGVTRDAGACSISHLIWENQ